MASSNNALADGVLDMLDSKGPTTESERVYRKIKSLHKQLLSLCVATDRRPGAADDEQIIIREQPLTFGRPPGEDQQDAFHAVESEIMAVVQRIIRADRSTNQKMVDAHQKLKALMRKVKTIVHFQHRQLRMDSLMSMARERFVDVLDEEILREGVQDLDMADLYGRFSSYKATPAAMELAEQTRGGAFLLVPGKNGWAGAMESAKRTLLLPPQFPDMSAHPLNKIAALELKRRTVTTREGIRRKTVTEGKLRLLSAPELNYMISHRATSDAYEHTPENLQIVPVEALDGAILFSRWIYSYSNLQLRPSNFLLYAELLEANQLAFPKLLDGLRALTYRLRWFMTAVQDFFRTRRRYASGPLRLYYGYGDLMTFPRAYVQSLAENLTDQIQHGGEVTEDIEDVLRDMNGLVNQTEGELLESGDSEDEEEEDDYYEDDPHQYFELDADLMRTPPENPDYFGAEEDDPAAGAEAPSAPSQLPDARPSAPTRTAPHQGRRDLPDISSRIRRGRSSSNESAHSEESSRRASPPATTASQIKGDGPTHTIALQLQRSRQVLMSMEANPDSTRYKNQRDKVGKMLALAEKHLRDDQDVSSSYEEFLLEEMERSEEACGAKDDEFDIAERKKKKAEDEKKDLLATLPRGLGQKFSGNPADWPNFRDHFVRIVKTVDPTLAVAHMTSLIDCQKLKRRMKIYSSGEQVLKDFDRDFGFNFLNCQTIINEINSLPNASNKSQEMDLILRYRHAKRSLDKNSDNEKLLNVPQLLVWADKLLQTTTDDLMEIIQSTEFGENGSPVEHFFSHIEKVYERSSVLTRNREARQPHPSGKNGQGHGKKGKQVEFETDFRRYGNEESEKGGCGAVCSTGPQHKTFNCPLIKSGKVGLKKIRQAKLCTCCLRNSADCQQGQIKKKDGTIISLACEKCKHNKRIPIHQNCKDKSGPAKSPPGQVVPVNGPPVPLSNDSPVAASLTELRTEISVLANPNPLGTAAELVDYCMLEAPNGSRITVRCLYDAGGTDTILDWRLGYLFHHYVPVTVGVNGAVGSRNFSSPRG